MKKKIIMVLFLVLFVLPSFALAGGHGHDRAVKKGILLVAFGSSMQEAQISFKNIEEKAKETFKNIPVHWAYTSSIIRKKLAKQGTHLNSVATALAKMMDQGFTHVAIQSLHTIRGEEFNDLVCTVHAFKNMPEGINHIVVGQPLLSSQKDIEKVVAAIINNIPKKRKKKEAVVLMGHGTHHPANAFYAALMFNLQRKDPNIFVGTVEGTPEIGDIKAMLTAKKIKKAYLIPFMSVAGDHARNDMAGDEDDSWKSTLTKAGIKCKVVLKGTAEYDNIVNIWIEHLKAAMAHLKG